MAGAMDVNLGRELTLHKMTKEEVRNLARQVGVSVNFRSRSPRSRSHRKPKHVLVAHILANKPLEVVPFAVPDPLSSMQLRTASMPFLRVHAKQLGISCSTRGVRKDRIALENEICNKQNMFGRNHANEIQVPVDERSGVVEIYPPVDVWGWDY